jgi:hypothetical protein
MRLYHLPGSRSMRVLSRADRAVCSVAWQGRHGAVTITRYTG